MSPKEVSQAIPDLGHRKMNRRQFLNLCALSAAYLTIKPAAAQGLVEKKTFSLESFQFVSGRTLPVKVGFETYGELNETKDNVVLICHYFAGHGHAAGRYRADDPAPGWWDSLIGPGKPIDTDRYFVVSSDVLCNLNAFNPDVITTGPASINPRTDKHYALDFPILTVKDMVSVQRELLRSLGVRRVQMVAGPSMGGLQAFAWARYFPDLVERILPVISLPMIRPLMLMNPGQLAIDTIKLDPNWNNGNYYGGPPPHKGLMLAFKTLLMSVKSDQSLQREYGRKIADPNNNPYEKMNGQFLVDTAMEGVVESRLHTFDANSYIYLSKAVTLFDLREKGQSLKQALGEITTRTLLINDESDLMFGPEQSKRAVEMLGDAELFLYNSGNGHLSGVFETHYFADRVRKFLNS